MSENEAAREIARSEIRSATSNLLGMFVNSQDGVHVFNDETGLWDRMRERDAERIIERLTKLIESIDRSEA